jgi:hypothetical protein
MNIAPQVTLQQFVDIQVTTERTLECDQFRSQLLQGAQSEISGLADEVYFEDMRTRIKNC